MLCARIFRGVDFWPRPCGLMLAACCLRLAALCLYIRACGLELGAEYVQVVGYDGADIG